MLVAMKSPSRISAGLVKSRNDEILAQRRFQHVIDLAGLKIEIAVEDEIGGRDDMTVNDAWVRRIAKRHGVLGGGHDFVGGDHEIGGAGHDARTGDVGGMSDSRTWLITAPPFCASPDMSRIMLALPSICAAMPSSAPMVKTPVPPTPPTATL